MRVKRVLRPERLRRIPAQFSWVDQRLVREHYVERCEAPALALALYLVLVTVADHQGLSYHGEAALSRCLSMAAARLRQARERLIQVGLIAYEAPLYQVLALDPVNAPAPAGAVKALRQVVPNRRNRVVLNRGNFAVRHFAVGRRGRFYASCHMQRIPLSEDACTNIREYVWTNRLENAGSSACKRKVKMAFARVLCRKDYDGLN